jgi:retron-type reverse transcriptase
MVKGRVNWVLDADIRSFFDTIDHAWMKKFVEHWIGDKRLVRLLMKWLKAGVMVEGLRGETVRGTPQGGIISPLLANIYLHMCSTSGLTPGGGAMHDNKSISCVTPTIVRHDGAERRP